MGTIKKYDLIDHTADIGVKAYGHSLKEAFANAALGLFSIISDVSNIREAESRNVEVRSPDINSLLVTWLNELVYIFEVNHLLFKRFEVVELADTYLKAVCHGEKYDEKRHHLKTGVKSATYHMLEIDRNNNQVQVIFDV